MLNTKKRPGHPGDFGRETPPLAGTAANVNMWFAAWHLDLGHTVAETERFVDILRKLNWSPTYVHDISLIKLLGDLQSCGYEYTRAPSHLGDMLRAMRLKISLIVHRIRAPSHNLPNLIIFPNAHFIHNTTPANAATDEIRGRLEKWFNNRPEVSDFKQLSMRFAYQCPVAFLGEVSWDGSDILFFSVSRLKKTMLAKYLEGGYLRALAADIGEARERVRAGLSPARLKAFQENFNGRARAS